MKTPEKLIAEIRSLKKQLAALDKSLAMIEQICQRERSRFEPANLDGHLNAIEGIASECRRHTEVV